ncbi:MAG: hypothetical protein LBR30_06610 [Clostridioides sp.]|nr:hypothetical protein [Clostridioides sp.]
MYSDLKEIDIELKKICKDYIESMKYLKDNDFITEEEFKKCTEDKINFLNSSDEEYDCEFEEDEIDEFFESIDDKYKIKK